MTFIRPLNSKRISDSFANHKNRKPPSGLPGTDYPCATGTKIVAVMDGTVVRANFLSSSGNNIKIQHADKSVSYYLHLSKFKVKTGQKVKQGELIGLAGSTGNSTGPHLHFSLANPKGVLVDPETMYGKTFSKPVITKPSSNKPNFVSSLKFGSRGEAVKYIQKKLGVKPVSGYFGELTKAAVIKFQKKKGLVADGIVGPVTYGAL